MNLNRSIWAVAAAVTVIGASTAIVPDARAGVQVFYFSTTASNAPCVAIDPDGPSYRVKYAWQFGGCPEVSFFTRWRYPFGAGGTCAPDAPSYNPARGQAGSANNVTWTACTVFNDNIQSQFDHVIMNGSVLADGFPSVYCECVGDVNAGPLGTSAAVGDTVISYVGSRSAPMRVNVVRSGDQLTLSNLTGQMYVNPGRVRKGPIRTSLILAVYKDSTDAFNANPLARGQALFWGRVKLNKDATGKSFGMDGDFTGSDFTSPTDSTAVPGTINKIVPLSGAAQPVVMLWSDPLMGTGSVPGTSPVGILALTAAMAGAGMWVMVRRRRMA